MAFVNEIIDDKGVNFLKLFNFKTPPICGGGFWLDHYFHQGFTKWVIDKEKDIIFITLCGQGYCFDKEYPPTYYYLIWKEIPIKIEAYNTSSGNNDIGIKAKWDIHKITAPYTLRRIQGEIIASLKKAINTLEHQDNRNIVSLEFVNIPTINFVSEVITNA